MLAKPDSDSDACNVVQNRYRLRYVQHQDIGLESNAIDHADRNGRSGHRQLIRLARMFGIVLLSVEYAVALNPLTQKLKNGCREKASCRLSSANSGKVSGR